MTPCRALTPMLSASPLRPLLRPTLLPFLYQTRSLRQFPRDDYIPTDPSSNPPSEDPWGYLYSATKSSPAPPPAYKPSSVIESPPVTTQEKEVFALIFKDLLNRAPDRPAIVGERFKGTYGQNM